MKTDVIRKHVLAAAVMLALIPVAATAQSTSSGEPGPQAPGSTAGSDQGKASQSKQEQNKSDHNKAVNLDETVVTASPGALTKMGSSVSVSSLEADQISDSGLQNAADILRNIPGIRAESSGGDGNANISVRGLPVASGGGKYVQFQVDGMPVLEFGDISFATPDTFLRPDYNIDHVDRPRRIFVGVRQQRTGCGDQLHHQDG
ncbi:Plug domain-containing protein [Rhodanobacter sp. MP1X3]|uniref:TonB-dependent receptor plug domain-containing protein n=1 Tax=Rhodanobacter sp. MP1X3 TaxID=2723086 RepID=UPI0017BA288C|nr:Plug domain-containing protein [Rhodanobacter sp. MP1X3]MBB6241691.1 outer membrane receptor protein involved in Fe transport [Rhodanobacter sp. MP1X3]